MNNTLTGKWVVLFKSKLIWLLLVIGVFCFGCDLLTSQKDIIRSIYTVMRGWEESTRSVEPQVINEYANATDLKFTSNDETLVNRMNILVKNDHTILASGKCFFSGYEDPYSGYTVEGELAYDCERSDKDYTSCEFSCNAQLDGGKVNQLDFSLELDSEGMLKVASVTANGKKAKFDQWDFVTQIIRTFNPVTGL